MKHGILAAAFLLTSAGFASADYVVIVANVGGSTKELKTAPNQMAGMRGMMGGPQGMYGGMPRQQGPGGGQGDPPRACTAGCLDNKGPGGGQGGSASGPPAGMGMRGGQQGGMMGMGGCVRRHDGHARRHDEQQHRCRMSVPDYIVAVVEVKPHNVKNLVRRFELAQLPVKSIFRSGSANRVIC